MNPLTLVKRIQNINSKEAALGISEDASWHAKYRDSAYVYIGGISFDLTEGDLLAVFAQYGEVVDVNLVRDKGTGKSKGFSFLAFEDQRSTNLAVDNLNGSSINGRIIRVDHVTKYKKKEEEDEEEERQKREARGVCRAFQRGECTRGAGCKFSHDEQRAANTGWGEQDRSSKWGHDRFEGPKKGEKKPSVERPSQNYLKPSDARQAKGSRRQDDFETGQKTQEDFNVREGKKLVVQGDDKYKPREDRYERDEKRFRSNKEDELEPKSREDRYERDEKRLRRNKEDELEPKSREDHYERDEKRLMRNEEDELEPKSKEDRYERDEKRLRRIKEDELEPNSREDHYERDEKRLRRNREDECELKPRQDEKEKRRHDSESYHREEQRRRGGERSSDHGRDCPSRRHREKDDYRRKPNR